MYSRSFLHRNLRHHHVDVGEDPLLLGCAPPPPVMSRKPRTAPGPQERTEGTLGRLPHPATQTSTLRDCLAEPRWRSSAKSCACAPTQRHCREIARRGIAAPLQTWHPTSLWSRSAHGEDGNSPAENSSSAQVRPCAMQPSCRYCPIFGLQDLMVKRDSRCVSGQTEYDS